jgi:aquaporin related protein
VNVSSPSLLQIFFISAGFGLSLTINAWIFFRVSGSAFNPAVSIVQPSLLMRLNLISVQVTLGLCLVGAVPWLRGLLVVPVQIGAGIAAAGLVSGLFPGPFDVQNTLGSGTTKVQGVFIEMVLTTELIFTIMMLAVEKHRASFVAPLGIGIALLLGHLIGKHRHRRCLLFQN